MKAVVILMLAAALVLSLPVLGYSSIPRFFEYSTGSAILIALWIVTVLGGSMFFALIID